jgi:hypothetical protein
VYDLTQCWDVDLFNREEASFCTSLSYPPTLLGKSGGPRLEYSGWVLQRVKEIHCVLRNSLWHI